MTISVAQGVPSSYDKVSTIASSGSAQTITDPWSSPFYTVTDVTLTAACAFTFPSAAAGKSFAIIVRQDGTGSRVPSFPTVTWLGGGVQASKAANSVDEAMFLCTDGTNWIGSYAPQQVSTGWTNIATFSNSWGNTGGSYVPARYQKDALGFVHLEGVCTAPSSGANSTAFVMPAGYRPGYLITQAAFSTRDSDTDVGGGIEVDTGGNVTLLTNTSSPYITGFSLVYLAEN